MEIKIEQAARNYIIKKSPDKSITLNVGTREGASCGCSVGSGKFPTVRLGVNPFDKNDYSKLDIDGVHVYYPADILSVFRTVNVKIEGILFFKQLLALGN